MNIELQNIKFKNFLSYGEEEVSFDISNGIDLITGLNGTGKTTIGEAIFYALYGKAYRKIKLASLINKINLKKLYVELVLSVDSKKYKVIRAMKPNRFEIFELKDDNFVLVDERASVSDYQKFFEEEVLGTSEHVFRQLVSVAANLPSSKPFMELSQSEKEEMFQVLTDTSVFNDLKQILRKKQQDKKAELKELEYKRSILESSVSSERNMIEQAKKRNEDFKNNHDENIRLTNESIKNCEDNIKKYLDAFEKIKKLKVQYDEKNIVLEEYKAKQSIELKKIQTSENSLSYILSAEKGAITCKNCSETNYLVQVDLTIKESLIAEISVLTESIEKTRLIILEEQPKIDEMKEKLLHAKRIQQSIEENKNNILYYNSKLEELKQIVPVSIDFESLKQKEEQLFKIQDETKQCSKDLSNIEELDNIVGKDNLKAHIIKQQIPLLNREINRFLELFSLLDYHFIIDENFKEKIITRDEDSEFQSLSNGQKARISFSIMFAFLKLIEERNSSKINLLILDEVLDSSVDSNGRDELLQILKDEFSLSKDILIISHSDEIKEKVEMFNRIINVKKEKFSSLEIDELR